MRLLPAPGAVGANKRGKSTYRPTSRIAKGDGLPGRFTVSGRAAAAHTRGMARTVTALVTAGGEYLGAVGPFPVAVPWWSEVEPIVAHLHGVLGVPVLVLRLLGVDGGEGARDGHVTYHVEAERRSDRSAPLAGHLVDPAALTEPAPPGHLVDPAALTEPAPLAGHPVDLAALTEPDPLRLPWATAGGVRELLDWATDTLATMGRPLTGPPEQRRTWNLAALFRLPTAVGPAWLKATPPFAADEAAILTAVAAVDPGLVPAVLAAGERRILLAHLPGEDCWNAGPEIIAAAVHRWVAVQATLAEAPGGLPAGLRDRRTPVLVDEVGALLDGPVGGQLTADERAAAWRLARRWPELDGCGLPAATLVHGDFHSGNWRAGPGHPPAVLDFADAYLGNPVLDGLRVLEFLPEPKRPAAARAWVAAWTARAPGSNPSRALAVAEPLGYLSYAVRYQEFLDNIEPSERIYHADDPVNVIRVALRLAREPGAHLAARAGRGS